MKQYYACRACGRRFGGLAGFDEHRVGALEDMHPDYGRRCLADHELIERGYRLKVGIWKKPMSTADLVRRGFVNTREKTSPMGQKRPDRGRVRVG